MIAVPFELPEQNIPDSKKDEKWHMKHGNMMIQYISGKDYEGRLGEIAEYEQKYLAEDMDRKSVTDPYGENLGQKYETYPLIEGIIDDIIGKYLSRPLKRKVYSVNRDAINSKLDSKMDYIMEEIFREVNKKVSEEAKVEVETENPDIELPENIEEFFSKSYKTNAEELSDELITNFLEVNKYKDKIKYLLTEYLYGDTCSGFMDYKGGHPELVRIRYDECYYDIDPSKEVQDDHEMFAYYKWYTENEIYNKFVLTKAEKKKVKDAFITLDDGSLLQDDIDMSTPYTGTNQNCSNGVSYKGWIDQQSKDRRHRLRVLVFTWKSRRDIRTLSFKNKKTGKTEYKLLPSEYKERSRDKIETNSFETIHMVKMLGPEILLEYGEQEDRNTLIDDPSKARINAFSLVGKTHLKSRKIRSLAAKLDGLQTQASDILFQMRTLINSIDGKIPIYDAAQVPKQFIDSYGAQNAINRVFHHMKKDKVMIINSADKKDRHTFNQFSTMDMTNRGLMKDLMDGLMLVEDLARKFVGLTKEAQEGGEKYETATSVNRSIIASNSRIEVYFEPFDSFMGVLLNKYLQKCKSVYEKGQVFQLIFGDMQSKFMTIHKDLFDVDLGLYIGDTAKDLRDKQIIDQGAQLALGTAQTPDLILDLINVLEKDNATESKAILERSVAAMAKVQEQAREDAQKQMEAEAQKQQAERDAKKAEHDSQMQNNIDVANIYNSGKAYDGNEDRASNERITAAKLAVDLEKDKNNKGSSSTSTPENKTKPKPENKPTDKK